MAIIDNLGRIIESQESTLTELRSIVSTLMQEQVGPARPVGEKNETQSNAINDLKNVFDTYLEQWKDEVAAQRELLTKTVDVLNEIKDQREQARGTESPRTGRVAQNRGERKREKVFNLGGFFKSNTISVHDSALMRAVENLCNCFKSTGSVIGGAMGKITHPSAAAATAGAAANTSVAGAAAIENDAAEPGRKRGRPKSGRKRRRAAEGDDDYNQRLALGEIQGLISKVSDSFSKLSETFTGGIKVTETLFKGIGKGTNDTRVELNKTLYQTQGITGASKELQMSWMNIGNVVRETGVEDQITAYKEYNKMLGRGIKSQQTAQRILKSQLSTEVQLGVETGSLGDSFAKMHNELMMSDNEIAQMGRGMREVQLSTGLSGDNLAKSMQQSEQIMKNLFNAGNLNTQSAKAFMEASAEGQKMGVDLSGTLEGLSDPSKLLMSGGKELDNILIMLGSRSGEFLSGQLTGAKLMKAMADQSMALASRIGGPKTLEGFEQLGDIQKRNLNMQTQALLGMSYPELLKQQGAFKKGSMTSADKAKEAEREIQKLAKQQEENIKTQMVDDKVLADQRKALEIQKRNFEIGSSTEVLAGLEKNLSGAKSLDEAFAKGGKTSEQAQKEAQAAVEKLNEGLVEAGKTPLEIDFKDAFKSGAKFSAMTNKIMDAQRRLTTNEAKGVDATTEVQQKLSETNADIFNSVLTIQTKVMAVAGRFLIVLGIIGSAIAGLALSSASLFASTTNVHRTLKTLGFERAAGTIKGGLDGITNRARSLFGMGASAAGNVAAGAAGTAATTAATTATTTAAAGGAMGRLTFPAAQAAATAAAGGATTAAGTGAAAATTATATALTGLRATMTSFASTASRFAGPIAIAAAIVSAGIGGVRKAADAGKAAATIFKKNQKDLSEGEKYSAESAGFLIGALNGVTGGLLGMFFNIDTWIKPLTLLLNKMKVFSLVFGLVYEVVRGVYEIIKSIFVAIWEVVKGIGGGIWNAIEPIFTGISDIFNSVSSIFGSTEKSSDGAFKALRLFGKAIDGVSWFIVSIGKGIGTVLKFIGSVIGFFVRGLMKAIEVIVIVISSVLAPVVEAISSIFEGLYEIGKGVYDAIAGIISIFSVLGGAGSGGMSFFGKMLNGLLEGFIIAGRVIGGFLRIIMNVIVIPLKLIGSLFSSVKSLFLSPIKGGLGIVSKVFKSIKKPIMWVFKKLSKLGDFLWNNTIGAFSGAGKWIWNNTFGALAGAGKWIWNNTIGRLAGAGKWIWDNTIGRLSRAGKWVWDNTIGALAGAGSWMWDNTVGALAGAGSWMWDNTVGALAGAGSWMWDNTVGALAGAGSWIWDNTIGALAGAGTWIWDNTVGALGQLGTWLYKNTIGRILSMLPSWLGGGGGESVTDVVETVASTVVSGAVDLTASIEELGVFLYDNTFGVLEGLGPVLYDNTFGVLEGLGPVLYDNTFGVLEGLGPVLYDNTFGVLEGLGQTVYDELAYSISYVGDYVYDTFMEVFKSVSDYISSILPGLETSKAVGEAVGKAFGSSEEENIKRVEEAGSGTASGMGRALGGVTELSGSKVLGGISEMGSATWGNLKSIVGYAEGSKQISETGLAVLHKDEIVIPSNEVEKFSAPSEGVFDPSSFLSPILSNALSPFLSAASTIGKSLMSASPMGMLASSVLPSATSLLESGPISSIIEGGKSLIGASPLGSLASSMSSSVFGPSPENEAAVSTVLGGTQNANFETMVAGEKASTTPMKTEIASSELGEIANETSIQTDQLQQLVDLFQKMLVILQPSSTITSSGGGEPGLTSANQVRHAPANFYRNTIGLVSQGSAKGVMNMGPPNM